jgi:hypothetical protein
MTVTHEDMRCLLGHEWVTVATSYAETYSQPSELTYETEYCPECGLAGMTRDEEPDANRYREAIDAGLICSECCEPKDDCDCAVAGKDAA